MNLAQHDYSGVIFGRLTARWHVGSKRPRWLCSCECGNLTIVNLYTLLHGETMSCGCLRREITTKKNNDFAEISRMRLLSGSIPGMNPKTHGMSRKPEHKSFLAARQRCRNPRDRAYRNYGGRGIEFRFKSFGEFYEEIGPRPTFNHSVDRINVNGHYEKGNVRWATRAEQVKNRRVKFITDFSTEELRTELARRGIQ